MMKLTKFEKSYNKWWLSRFDNKNYKTICLFNGDKKIQEYTTANSRYTDLEDAECAFWVVKQMGLQVTTVSVNGTKYKIKKGKEIK